MEMERTAKRVKVAGDNSVGGQLHISDLDDYSLSIILQKLPVADQLRFGMVIRLWLQFTIPSLEALGF